MTSSIGRVYRPHVSIFDFCIWQMVLLDGKNEREMRGIVWKRKNQWGEVRDRQREEKKRENEKVRGRARMAALTKSESQTKNGDASKKKLLSFTSALLSFILSAFTFRHSICVLYLFYWWKFIRHPSNELSQKCTPKSQAKKNFYFSKNKKSPRLIQSKSNDWWILTQTLWFPSIIPALVRLTWHITSSIMHCYIYQLGIDNVFRW